MTADDELPIERLFEICCGMIGWTPESFWKSSWIEVQNAVKGFAEFNSDGKPPPLARDEFDELRELYPD